MRWWVSIALLGTGAWMGCDSAPREEARARKVHVVKEAPAPVATAAVGKSSPVSSPESKPVDELDEPCAVARTFLDAASRLWPEEGDAEGQAIVANPEAWVRGKAAAFA